MTDQPDMTTREAGYYWVRFRFENSYEPAEWTGEEWRVLGDYHRRTDAHFGRISQRINPDD